MHNIWLEIRAGLHSFRTSPSGRIPRRDGVALEVPPLPAGVVTGMSVFGDGSVLAVLLDTSPRPVEVAIVRLGTADPVRYPTDSRPAFFSHGDAVVPVQVRFLSGEGIFTPAEPAGRGCDWDEVFAGYCDGAQQAAEQHGVRVRLTPDIPRGYPLEAAELTARYAVAYRDRGVVGIGLGGPEAEYPPEPFARAFQIARDGGLGSVPHAGEAAGPASVRGALDTLCADRIRHGIRAVEDPGLLRELADLPLCHAQRRQAAAGGFVEDAAEPVSDGGELLLDLRLGEAVDLAGDGAHDSAGARDGLAAAVGQVGECGLGGHRGRQAQRVVQAVPPGVVGLDPAAAERGSHGPRVESRLMMTGWPVRAPRSTRSDRGAFMRGRRKIPA